MKVPGDVEELDVTIADGDGLDLVALRAKIDPDKLSPEQATLLRAWHQYAPDRLPTPIPEYPFARQALGRQWRIDVAWPEVRVGLEFEGGVFARSKGRKCPTCGEIPSGRHTTGAGFVRDLQKYNAARAQGWIVMQYAVPIFKRNSLIVFKEILDIVRARQREMDLWRELSATLHGLRNTVGDLRGDLPVYNNGGNGDLDLNQLGEALATAQKAGLALLPTQPLSYLDSFGRTVIARRRKR